MKTTLRSSIVLLAIIGILGGALGYEILQRQKVARRQEQYLIALTVQLHQELEQGQVEATQRRLGALVTVQSLHYEKKYGPEVDTEFAPRLAEARVIREDFARTQPPATQPR